MIYNTTISDIAKYLEELGNPWKDIQDINVLIPNLINLVLVITVVVFFFLLLLGGIQWITSGGDKEALAKAQGKITAALVGIIIVFSAWAILNLVKYFFGTPPESASECALEGETCEFKMCCSGLECDKGTNKCVRSKVKGKYLPL